MAINYPLSVIVDGSKTAYCYRCQELLRLVHNTFVKWREEGLTELEFSALPWDIKVAFDYMPQINIETWKRFRDEEFLPRSETIQEEILRLRALHKTTTRWTIDVGEVEKFVRT